jgi:hypothetical protein
MAPKPPPFPGEMGFALLECVAERYENQGQVSGCHYMLSLVQRIYADARDLSGMDKGAFKKHADSIEAGSGTEETPQLDRDRQGSRKDA